MATGWNDGLCQDYDKGLGRWFADRLGARQQLRQDFAMTQHITQEQATQIAAQFAEDATYEFNIANAAIQHYIDQRAKDLPELPPTKLYKDANGVLHPTAAHCRTAAEMEAYGQQCAAHARKLALEEAKLVAKTTCHHESTEFANGFNMAALNIESAIEALKGKR